jgi:hypothetical protein
VYTLLWPVPASTKGLAQDQGALLLEVLSAGEVG